jgi:CRP-like cAMP-binding protein
MVGTEGAGSLLEACGSGRSSLTSLVQIDGLAIRAPASACRELAHTDPEFAAATWRLIELQMTESRQSGMCQALHPVEPRLARWLIECSERCAGRNPMPLTQEFISAMLGVQRTTVTAIASQLEKVGLIS